MAGENTAVTAYKEETWGKDEDGEYVTDGYKYFGKTAFKKALDGLKDSMKKGTIGEKNGIKYQVLDKRPSGTGIDIEIQVTANNNNRGNAMLKLYGPSKKKQNVVLVTRSKGYDSKFMKILAENVIKPSIDAFLEETKETLQSPNSKSFVSVDGKEVKMKECPHCGKTFLTISGLKTHITRMHKKKENRKRHLSESDNVDDHILKEATKVVDLILDEMIGVETEDSIEETKEVTLNEMPEDIDENVPKKYSNKCDNCEFEAKAGRKFKVLQILKQHRELCQKIKTCEIGGCEVKDIQNMKKHMRDEHSETTASTSPPLKRKRKLAVNTKTVEENTDTEEMEIDYEESEILSQRMDKKIEQKAKENEEKDQVLKEKIKEKIEKKNKEEEKRQEIEKIKKRQAKQSKKDLRKSTRKKMKKIKEVKLPNIKDVPENIKHLVDKDDVIYEVPGNGACGPNSASAFLFSDEVFGPKLRRNMNIFMARHWDKHYQYKSQCSEDSPFIRKMGNKTISFTNTKELKHFLMNSEEAAYMWSDSEDLAVIADMYQIKIKVITSKGADDKNPIVHWINPEMELKQYAELKDVDLKELILFHENDCHFDLIVNKNHDLATLGSLSYRFNVGPILESNEPIEEEEEAAVEVDKDTESPNNDHKRCKDELKRCQETNRKLKGEYIKCEQELRNKTEEVEKLKIELNLIKQTIELEKECNSCTYSCSNKEQVNSREKSIHTHDNKHPCKICNLEFRNKSQLSNHLKNEHADDKPEILEKKKIEEQVETKSSNKVSIEIFRCVICAFISKSKDQLIDHIKRKHTNVNKDEEYNCEGCDFQGTSMLQLNKHMNLKHTDKNQPMREVIKCRNCDEQFSHKWNLMNHRKQKHIETVGHCKKKQDGNCPFSDDKCWWKHQEKQKLSTEHIECYICNKIFQDKPSMMMHRKAEHRSIIRKCDKHLNKSCPFQSNACWYIHDEEEDMEIEEQNCNKEEQKQSETSVFRNLSVTLKPPLMKTKKD